MTIRDLPTADTNIVVGTSALNDLGATLRTDFGMDIAGALILSVRGHGSWIGTVGGSQQYSMGLMVGPITLDAADLLPATTPNDQYWVHRSWLSRGQQHNVLAAASEFTERHLAVHTRGSRRIPNLGSTLLLAQEVLNQTQQVRWLWDIRIAV